MLVLLGEREKERETFAFFPSLFACFFPLFFLFVAVFFNLALPRF